MEAARAFAEDWVAAWHSRDIDAILSHYCEDIKFYSPRVKARYVVSGVGEADGVLTGKDSLQAYFQEALDKLKVIRLTIQDVMLGLQGSIAVVYTRETGAKVVEVFELDQQGKAAVVRVYYDAVC
eukprot:GHUV01007234.1.p1 GENE.GHUV01007234.1~~GHUV01007234.1.p1  ORF type:complete len:125 (+),score=27.95 GHUV01007234.1:145-519(+)